MITASAAIAQPSDWRRAFRDAYSNPQLLLHDLGLQSLARRIPSDCAGFPLRVPRGYVARMRHADPHDPLLRQVLPLDDELRPQPGFSTDAVGDHAARRGNGVLHKYHGRALLLATGNCAVHCRYCFRRHYPYAEDSAAASGWSGAIDTLRANPGISEVILSGGDPLSLSTAKLADLGEALTGLPQVRRLRIHSRLPVVLPERIDAALLAWLEALPLQKVMVMHANHGNEIDASVEAASAGLSASGVHLLNQSVLLRGVNDDVATLAALSEALFSAGVLPYYLHQLDRVSGTAHFEVADTRALQLESELRALLPGYLVPRLVREVAGEPGKTPLAVP